jgi:hypothetical protein
LFDNDEHGAFKTFVRCLILAHDLIGKPVTALHGVVVRFRIMH